MEIARHTISLAAYLMGAREGSYFSSGLHWFDLVPGTAEKAWPIWCVLSHSLSFKIYHTARHVKRVIRE